MAKKKAGKELNHVMGIEYMLTKEEGEPKAMQCEKIRKNAIAPDTVGEIRGDAIVVA